MSKKRAAIVAFLTGIGSMVIPEGNAIEFSCDKGNTLGDMVITPTTTAQVSYFN